MKRNRMKLSENFHLKKSVSISVDQENQVCFKIIATLPVDTEAVEQNLANSNLNDVTKEYDQKMKKLSDTDKEQMEGEFQKLSVYSVKLSTTGLTAHSLK